MSKLFVAKYMMSIVAIASLIACSDSSTSPDADSKSASITTQTVPAQITFNGGAPATFVSGFAEYADDAHTKWNIELHVSMPSDPLEPWGFLVYDYMDTNWYASFDVVSKEGTYAFSGKQDYAENKADVYAKRYDSNEKPIYMSYYNGAVRITKRGTDSLYVEIDGTGVGQDDASLSSTLKGFITIPIKPE